MTVPVNAGEITPAWPKALSWPQGWPRVEAVRTNRLPGVNTAFHVEEERFWKED